MASPVLEGGYDVLTAEEFAALDGWTRCDRCDHYRHEHGLDPLDPDGGAFPFQCLTSSACPCMEFLMPSTFQGGDMKSAAAAAAEPPAGPAAPEFRMIPIGDIIESELNPRKHFDPVQLADLEASIREKGILTPLLVRPTEDVVAPVNPISGRWYELAAGHRRLRAAREAGLAFVPAVIREMDEASFLEVLTIENDQREGVHPLEQAAGYSSLMLRAGYSAKRIAERTGRSEKYVYDRIKLLDLVDEAAEMFLDGLFTPGHAILLARLKPEDQRRALGNKDHHYDDGGLFTHEDTVFREQSIKAVSVRELEAWIDDSVRLDVAAPDPMLFPQVAATVATAQEKAERVVHITHLYRLEPGMGSEEQTLLEGQWKRADGEQKTKTCPSAALGVIVVGPGRGGAFKVCAAKKECKVHWATEIRQAKETAAARSTGYSRGSESDEMARYKREEEKRRLQREAAQAEDKRWEKARPAIIEAAAARLMKAPITHVGRLVLDELANPGTLKQLSQHMAVGGTADNFIRCAAMAILYDRLLNDYNVSNGSFLKLASSIGFNVKATVDAAVPREPKATPGKEAKGKKAAPAKRRPRAQASA